MVKYVVYAVVLLEGLTNALKDLGAGIEAIYVRVPWKVLNSERELSWFELKAIEFEFIRQFLEAVKRDKKLLELRIVKFEVEKAWWLDDDDKKQEHASVGGASD